MSDSQRKRDILNETVGPTTAYGKHSSYYKKGKTTIVVHTKKNEEELPEGVNIKLSSKKTLFEDSKGNIKLSFELDDGKPSYDPFKKFGGMDW